MRLHNATAVDSGRHQPTETTLTPLFFIQTRSGDQPSLWFYLYPLHRVYGYPTIEAAEATIVELEQQDEEWDLNFEYRIKEELA